MTEIDRSIFNPIKDMKGIPLDKSPILQSAFIEGKNIIAVLEVDPAQAGGAEPIRQMVEATLKQHYKDKSVRAILSASKSAPEFKSSEKKTARPPVRENLKPSQIGQIIAVASGKGGVGKSTVAVNLASALRKTGLRIGLMDADIYGPSIPHAFGLSGHRATMKDGKVVPPVTPEGLTLMSIGFLVDAEQPMIWRGPMIQSAIRQFLQDVAWPELDILVVDMQPGTGDAQLTMAQKVPMSGAVIVSTPQDLALIDARKGIEMFAQVSVPILGLIENMSGHQCSSCGHIDPIFGQGSLAEEAQKYDTPLLGQIPLTLSLRQSMDEAKPLNHDCAAFFDEIAQKLQQSLSPQAHEVST